ncbi:MAG: YfhO family protein [Candidatus Roseilinea sp.]|uniref:YfhO family protein n=1 Tax=Candidatus Roseilinea sp. TaxID=2838777 RepID=UPI00404906F0
MLLRLAKNEYLHAVGILSAVCLFFLSWPILNYEDHVFSPVGLLQNNTLTRVAGNPPWVNPYLGDVVYVIQPWLLYNHDSLHAGRLPLWNPYNGSGMPHLANFQSAIFSVFTLPFYVLDFKAAVLVSSFLALFAHGFFAFAFLKQIRLHQTAALIGAIAYMFGGYHVIWLGWLPLIGSGVALPAALCFAEAVFNRLNSAPPKRIFWPLAGFTVSLLVGLLAGHPETFYAALVLTAAYVAFRLLRQFGQWGWNRQSLRRALILGGQFLAAAILAPLLASAQLAPFIEYLSHSGFSNAVHKSAVQLPAGIVPLMFFPNLLGNPSGQYRPTLEISPQLWNFPESNSLYLGSLILFLAVLSLLLLRRSWHARFFGLAALLWLAYVFNLFSTRELFKLIPGASIVLPIRTYDIWLFSVSCSAALLIDHAWKAQQPRLGWAIAILSLGTVMLAGAWFLANGLLQQFSTAVLRDGAAFLSHTLPHIAAISASFLLGVALTASLFLATRRWQRWALATALGLVVFYQGGYLLKPYNPIAHDRLFYPVTPVLQRLQREVGDSTLVVLGEDTIPPNVSMVYRLRMLTGYDGFWQRPQRKLYRAAFDALPSALIPSRKAEPRALQMFGVEWVATIGQDETLAGNPDFQQVWVEDQVRLYRYINTLTRYFTVDAYMLAADEREAQTMAQSMQFDPARFVLLIADDVTPAVGPAAAQSVNPSSEIARPARVIADTGDYVKLQVARDRPGFLVLAVTHDPGWKAKVNGAAQPVLRANYTFSAVALPAGDSVIEFYYDPDSFKLGVAFSAIGFALAGGLIVTQGLRRPASRTS